MNYSVTKSPTIERYLFGIAARIPTRAPSPQYPGCCKLPGLLRPVRASDGELLRLVRAQSPGEQICYLRITPAPDFMRECLGIGSSWRARSPLRAVYDFRRFRFLDMVFVHQPLGQRVQFEGQSCCGRTCGYVMSLIQSQCLSSAERSWPTIRVRVGEKQSRPTCNLCGCASLAVY